MLSGAGSLPPPGHSLPRHVRAVLRRPVAQVHGRVSAGIRLPALARAEVRGPRGGAGRDLPRRAGAGARRRPRLGHPPRGLRGGGRAVCELAPGGRPQRRARDRAVRLRPLRLRSLCAASSPSSIRATRVAPSGSPSCMWFRSSRGGSRRRPPPRRPRGPLERARPPGRLDGGAKRRRRLVALVADVQVEGPRAEGWRFTAAGASTRTALCASS
jgi:hypothetical protein